MDTVLGSVHDVFRRPNLGQGLRQLRSKVLVVGWNLLQRLRLDDGLYKVCRVL